MTDPLRQRLLNGPWDRELDLMWHKAMRRCPENAVWSGVYSYRYHAVWAKQEGAAPQYSEVPAYFSQGGVSQALLDDVPDGADWDVACIGEDGPRQAKACIMWETEAPEGSITAYWSEMKIGPNPAAALALAILEAEDG